MDIRGYGTPNDYTSVYRQGGQMMEIKKRKKILVMGILFIFLVTILAPGIYAHIYNGIPVRRINQQTPLTHGVLQEENTVQLHIYTALGPIITRTATLTDETNYKKLQESMEDITQIASSYNGNTKMWLEDMEQRIDNLLIQLKEIGLIKNDNDKKMIKNQIMRGHETQLEQTWEKFTRNDSTLNNSLCLIAGYGTQDTRMEFTLRNPLIFSIARIVLAVLEFALRYDFTLASQILNYLSTDHLLNLALYCQYIIDENRTLKPPWVGVFTYGQNGYQATTNNSNTTLLGYAGLAIDFYFGLENIYALDSTGIIGFATYAKITPRPT